MQVLTVALFASNDAEWASVLQPYLDGANRFLKPFQMSIDIFPTGGVNNTPRILSYTGAVFDSTEDAGTLRQLAHGAVPVGRGIPVIFCHFKTQDSKTADVEYAKTYLTSNPASGAFKWLPYILINTQIKSSRNEVLLHELIHAAYGDPERPHDKDENSVFYKYADNVPEKRLPPEHVDPLRRAYFHSFK